MRLLVSEEGPGLSDAGKQLLHHPSGLPSPPPLPPNRSAPLLWAAASEALKDRMEDLRRASLAPELQHVRG